jgi:hypothetical protein
MASINTPYGGGSLSDKMLGITMLGAVGLGALITYRLGYWGNFNKGTDQNANIKVDESKLADPSKVKYKNIADGLYQEMNKTGWTLFSKLYPMVSELNTEELKQVVKEFGTRASTVPFTNFALSGERYNLFTWFERDIQSSDNLNKMKLLFNKTDLWSSTSFGTGAARKPVERPKIKPRPRK